VIHDLPTIVERAHRDGALVLCDATQGLGRIPVRVGELGCDLLQGFLFGEPSTRS